MENHNTGTINSSARYCLAKPGDKVRITKTHRAGIHQYLACEGDTFIITKVVDNQIPLWAVAAAERYAGGQGAET